MRRIQRAALCLLFAAAACALDDPGQEQVVAQTVTQTAAQTVAQAVSAARSDGKPLLVVVRGEDDALGIDLGAWLREDAAAGAATSGLHLLLLWRHQAEAQAFTPPSLKDDGNESWIMRLPPDAGDLGSRLISRLPSARAHYREDLAKIASGSALPETHDSPQSDDLSAFLVARLDMDRPDPAAVAALARAVRAHLEQPLDLEHVPLLDYFVYLLNDPALRQSLHQRLLALPGTHAVIGCELDLADEALTDHDLLGAEQLYSEVAEQAHEAPLLAAAARAMRALPAEASAPARQAWEARQALDVCVLVDDLPGFVAAISHWSAQTYFPVLFRDDRFAPRFISAFHPARLVHLPALGSAVDAHICRQALLRS